MNSCIKMTTRESHVLNPLASTFFPSKPFEKESTSIRSIAIQKLEKSPRRVLTISEVCNLLVKSTLIYYKDNPCISNNPSFKLKLKKYFANKIAKVIQSQTQIGQSEIYLKNKSRTFDFSVYRPPAETNLLVAFSGLYRHEQALKPILSLPYRPETLQDQVWSVTDNDLKLWNLSSVKPCGCPPMFGYTIPPGVFGNPFNLSNPCSLSEIHLTHSAESTEGNEFILQMDTRNYSVDSEVFTNFEEKLDGISDLDYYSEKMKTIVYDICNCIANLEELPKVKIEPVADEDYGIWNGYPGTLWDTDSLELDRPRSDEVQEDDGCHPLLDVTFPENEEVQEIKELTRRSVSNDSVLEIPASACDPPCSIWCPKIERSDSLLGRQDSDSSAIGLLNDTTDFMTGISSDIRLIKNLKPSFIRSFSANDCDPSYEQKYRAEIVASSRERLSRLRHDPSKNSWKDSGIGIHCSSQEDVFSDSESEENSGSSYKAPMWTFFSGEDSLWQPLPASKQPAKSGPHKRVKGIRRQMSSVN